MDWCNVIVMMRHIRFCKSPDKVIVICSRIRNWKTQAPAPLWFFEGHNTNHMQSFQRSKLYHDRDAHPQLQQERVCFLVYEMFSVDYNRTLAAQCVWNSIWNSSHPIRCKQSLVTSFIAKSVMEDTSTAKSSFIISTIIKTSVDFVEMWVRETWIRFSRSVNVLNRDNSDAHVIWIRSVHHKSSKFRSQGSVHRATYSFQFLLINASSGFLRRNVLKGDEEKKRLKTTQVTGALELLYTE